MSGSGYRVSRCSRVNLLWHARVSYRATSHPPFNGPFSGTTRVSRYQKGKTNLDFTEASDSEWQWHQLGYMQVCTLLQTDNHTSTPPLCFFTDRMPFLPPNQQRQSTEGVLRRSRKCCRSKLLHTELVLVVLQVADMLRSVRTAVL